MASTGNLISVCNRALSSLGTQSAISSLSESSAEANACSLWFQSVFEQLARTAPWGCLRAQSPLTLQLAAQGTQENPNGTPPFPPPPWSYQYAYPSNCLQMRFLLPSLTSPAGGVPLFSIPTGSPLNPAGVNRIPYIIAYNTDANGNPLNTILTNLSQAQGVFTVNQPNPQVWDSSFQAAMVASLAAFICPALTLHLSLMNMQVKIAEQLISEARTRDGNEAPASQNRTASWIAARSGGSGSCNQYNQNPYSNMIWPGGG